MTEQKGRKRARHRRHVQRRHLQQYWDIYSIYALLLLGIGLAYSCSLECEELGCLGCIVIVTASVLGTGALAFVSIIVRAIHHDRHGWLFLMPVLICALMLLIVMAMN